MLTAGALAGRYGPLHLGLLYLPEVGGAAITAVLGLASDGAAPLPGGWPVRYAARRIAWHVLDHAWEIEDKSEG